MLSGGQKDLIPGFQEVDDGGPEEILGRDAEALRLLGEVFGLGIAETDRKASHDKIIARMTAATPNRGFSGERSEVRCNPG